MNKLSPFNEINEVSKRFLIEQEEVPSILALIWLELKRLNEHLEEERC